MESLVIFCKIALVITGGYLICIPLAIGVDDFLGNFVFRILPFGLGITCLITWLVWSGFIIRIP